MLIRVLKAGLWMALGAGAYALVLQAPWEDSGPASSKASASRKPKAKPPKASSLVGPKAKSHVPAAKPRPPAFSAPMHKGMTTLPKTGLAGFSFPRIALASGVQNREPVDTAQVFAKDSRVYLFLEAKNASTFGQGLTVRWHSPKQEIVEVKLQVPASRPRYRTWAHSSTLTSPGPHAVSLHFEGGHELLRLPFEVKP